MISVDFLKIQICTHRLSPTWNQFRKQNIPVSRTSLIHHQRLSFRIDNIRPTCLQPFAKHVNDHQMNYPAHFQSSKFNLNAPSQIVMWVIVQLFLISNSSNPSLIKFLSCIRSWDEITMFLKPLIDLLKKPLLSLIP